MARGRSGAGDAQTVGRSIQERIGRLDVEAFAFFPLQVAIGRSRPGSGFTGGAFLRLEQRTRRRPRGESVDLAVGEAVLHERDRRGRPGGGPG